MKRCFQPGLTIKTATLHVVLLGIMLFAIGTGLHSFHQFQSIITQITGPQFDLLLTATKLVQQSDGIISSSSTLLLATNQSERRRALFELADRDEWMDKLVRKLRTLSPPSKSFNDVVQAKENLLTNLHELDSIIKRRIELNQTPPPSGQIAVSNNAELADITRLLNIVMQKNRLYSTELGIAVGYYVAKVKEEILQNAQLIESRMNNRRWYLIAAAVLSATAVLAIALYMHLSIVKRIVNLQHTVGEGRVSPSDIRIDGHDEIGKLAHTVKKFVFKISRDEERILSANKKLSFLATHDVLTDLFNRRHFEEIVAELTASPKASYCIGIIDIDHFKKINDRYGHKTGDQALVHMAEVIKSGLRNTDVLARYGGEEFVVIMFDTDQESAFKVFERIRAKVESTPFQSDKGPVRMTASFGIARRTGAGQSVEDCLRCADEAMYTAKNNGRNTVVLYTPNPGVSCEA